MGLEENLIRSYKEDFHKRTGHELKAFIKHKLEIEAHFIQKINPKLALLILYTEKNWNLQTLLSQSRKSSTVLKRHVIMYIFRANGLLLDEIGDIFTRDHSTVIASIASAVATVETTDEGHDYFFQTLKCLTENYARYHNFTSEEVRLYIPQILLPSRLALKNIVSDEIGGQFRSLHILK